MYYNSNMILQIHKKYTFFASSLILLLIFIFGSILAQETVVSLEQFRTSPWDKQYKVFNDLITNDTVNQTILFYILSSQNPKKLLEEWSSKLNKQFTSESKLIVELYVSLFLGNLSFFERNFLRIEQNDFIPEIFPFVQAVYSYLYSFSNENPKESILSFFNKYPKALELLLLIPSSSYSSVKLKNFIIVTTDPAIVFQYIDENKMQLLFYHEKSDEMRIGILKLLVKKNPSFLNNALQTIVQSGSIPLTQSYIDLCSEYFTKLPPHTQNEISQSLSLMLNQNIQQIKESVYLFLIKTNPSKMLESLKSSYAKENSLIKIFFIDNAKQNSQFAYPFFSFAYRLENKEMKKYILQHLKAALDKDYKAKNPDIALYYKYFSDMPDMELFYLSIKHLNNAPQKLKLQIIEVVESKFETYFADSEFIDAIVTYTVNETSDDIVKKMLILMNKDESDAILTSFYTLLKNNLKNGHHGVYDTIVDTSMKLQFHGNSVLPSYISVLAALYSHINTRRFSREITELIINLGQKNYTAFISDLYKISLQYRQFDTAEKLLLEAENKALQDMLEYTVKNPEKIMVPALSKGLFSQAPLNTIASDAIIASLGFMPKFYPHIKNIKYNHNLTSSAVDAIKYYTDKTKDYTILFLPSLYNPAVNQTAQDSFTDLFVSFIKENQFEEKTDVLSYILQLKTKGKINVYKSFAFISTDMYIKVTDNMLDPFFTDSLQYVLPFLENKNQDAVTNTIKVIAHYKNPETYITIREFAAENKNNAAVQYNFLNFLPLSFDSRYYPDAISLIAYPDNAVSLKAMDIIAMFPIKENIPLILSLYEKGFVSKAYMFVGYSNDPLVILFIQEFKKKFSNRKMLEFIVQGLSSGGIGKCSYEIVYYTYSLSDEDYYYNTINSIVPSNIHTLPLLVLSSSEMLFSKGIKLSITENNVYYLIFGVLNSNKKFVQETIETLIKLNYADWDTVIALMDKYKILDSKKTLSTIVAKYPQKSSTDILIDSLLHSGNQLSVVKELRKRVLSDDELKKIRQGSPKTLIFLISSVNTDTTSNEVISYFIEQYASLSYNEKIVYLSQYKVIQLSMEHVNQLLYIYSNEENITLIDYINRLIIYNAFHKNYKLQSYIASLKLPGKLTYVHYTDLAAQFSDIDVLFNAFQQKKPLRMEEVFKHFAASNYKSPFSIYLGFLLDTRGFIQYLKGFKISITDPELLKKMFQHIDKDNTSYIYFLYLNLIQSSGKEALELFPSISKYIDSETQYYLYKKLISITELNSWKAMLSLLFTLAEKNYIRAFDLFFNKFNPDIKELYSICADKKADILLEYIGLSKKVSDITFASAYYLNYIKSKKYNVFIIKTIIPKIDPLPVIEFLTENKMDENSFWLIINSINKPFVLSKALFSNFTDDQLIKVFKKSMSQSLFYEIIINRGYSFDTLLNQLANNQKEMVYSYVLTSLEIFTLSYDGLNAAIQKSSTVSELRNCWNFLYKNYTAFSNTQLQDIINGFVYKLVLLSDFNVFFSNRNDAVPLYKKFLLKIISISLTQHESAYTKLFTAVDYPLITLFESFYEMQKSQDSEKKKRETEYFMCYLVKTIKIPKDIEENIIKIIKTDAGLSTVFWNFVIKNKILGYYYLFDTYYGGSEWKTVKEMYFTQVGY